MLVCLLVMSLKFQFSPLQEGRRYFKKRKETKEKFQFSPLQEGRPSHVMDICEKERVSILAPARGAT